MRADDAFGEGGSGPASGHFGATTIVQRPTSNSQWLKWTAPIPDPRHGTDQDFERAARGLLPSILGVGRWALGVWRCSETITCTNDAQIHGSQGFPPPGSSTGVSPSRSSTGVPPAAWGGEEEIGASPREEQTAGETPVLRRDCSAPGSSGAAHRPSTRPLDAIVIGLGGWGSAALCHLARRGLRVAGLEQFTPGTHTRGSSHGDSRIIRMAYFMHPDYVPVLHRAYAGWRELEAATSTELMHLPGLLCIGEPDGPFIGGLERCYATHFLEHERLTPADARARYPQFAVPEDAACYHDPYGGFLRPEACVQAHLQVAEEAKATIHGGGGVLGWERDCDGFTVQTTGQTLRAAKLVIAAGAFTNRLLASTGSAPVQPKRKVLFWYRTAEPSLFTPDRFPCWIAKLGGRNYYGFPALDGVTIKAAEDSGGQELDDPTHVDPELVPGDETHLRPFLELLFPGRVASRERWATCLYEETGDRHFIVDGHPRVPGLIVAAGGSGHGFKFCSAIGEMVADLVQHNDSPHRPEIFRAGVRL